MKRGEVLSATARAERARATTKAVIAREVLYASILARIWPAYIVDVTKPDEAPHAFPFLLCIESPAGVLRWPLDIEERALFDFVPTQTWDGEQRADRTAVLLALATEGGWAPKQTRGVEA